MNVSQARSDAYIELQKALEQFSFDLGFQYEEHVSACNAVNLVITVDSSETEQKKDEIQ